MYLSNLNVSAKFKPAPKSSINFGAGWSAQVERQISGCNVSAISDIFERQGIKTDFKGNKVIAWCCLKTLEIFNELNQKYKLKLALPKAIYVEDFSELLEQDPKEYGICNFYPGYLKKGSEQVYSERTVLFNSFESSRKVADEDGYKWENIDSTIEDLYSKGFLSSGHFLGMFIHEFSHSAHNANLLIKLSSEEFLNKTKIFSDARYLTQFNRRLGKLFSKISKSAESVPFETIAEDMTRRIATSLDPQKLLPAQNPFYKSLYPVSSIRTTLQALRTSPQDDEIANKVLRKIWNGEDVLK